MSAILCLPTSHACTHGRGVAGRGQDAAASASSPASSSSTGAARTRWVRRPRDGGRSSSSGASSAGSPSAKEAKYLAPRHFSSVQLKAGEKKCLICMIRSMSKHTCLPQWWCSSERMKHHEPFCPFVAARCCSCQLHQWPCAAARSIKEHKAYTSRVAVLQCCAKASEVACAAFALPYKHNSLDVSVIYKAACTETLLGTQIFN